MDINISQLAAETAKFLAPLLPFLIQGARDAAKAAFERAGERLTDEIWDKGKALWEKLNPRIEGRDAIKLAEKKPDDPKVIQNLQTSLELQLEYVFQEDKGLARSINLVMTGDSSLVIGRDMKNSNAIIGDGNLTVSSGGKITKTVNNYYGEQKSEKKKSKKTSANEEPLSDEEIRKNYLNTIISDCKRARLVGLDPQAADVTRGAFSLDHLYVSLDTKTPTELKKEEREKNDRDFQFEKARPLSVLEALSIQSKQCMVLLGLPGSGKSTFVRYLSLWHAQALLDTSIDISAKLPKWEGNALLPIIIPLGRLAETLPKTNRGNAAHIETYVKATTSISENLIKEIKEEGALFLFDGLDEVADLNLRPTIVEAIEDFAKQYSQNNASRFLVTCRTFSYTDPRWQLTSWASHELAPLTRKKINEFIDYWHKECIAVDPARKDDYEEKRKKLHEALQEGDHRRLWEIADNPLILTVMAVVHTHKGDLPDARALVYEECIDLLLLRWEAERTVTGKSQRRDLRSALNVPEIALRNVLQEIAYHAHERGRKTNGKREDQAALVTEDLLRADLYAAFQDNTKVQTFVDYCESSNGLLMLQGVAPLPDAPPDAPPRRVYAFPHLTFEEYLAARYLRRMKTLGQNTFEHLTRSDRWREVVMLLGEHICFREGDYELMDSILNSLAPLKDMAISNEDWKARWAAGDLLLLYQRAFEQRKNQHSHVSQTLVDLLEGSRLTPRERAEAGNTLARLGDPRPGVTHDFLFCEIPAGKFLMVSPESDKQADGDEKPQFEYNLPHNYFISRYPVTNAQFNRFVSDPQGYSNNQWWTKAGLEWRKERKEHQRYGGVFSLANHPVVGVTWYEAHAFCNWLTHEFQMSDSNCLVYDHKTGAIAEDPNLKSQIVNRTLIFRLPSEAQWERAARGSSALTPSRYPWKGDEITPAHANYSDTNLNATSAVGAFPKGMNDYGLLDMSGNVWEWCATEWQENYDKYTAQENNKPDGTALRVLRGGAFNGLDWGVRCACRYGSNPYSEYFNGGFRVVAVSHFS